MQIITGKYKNRILKIGDKDNQSKSVVRHAIFNIIGSNIFNAAVIDLFSDSGYYAIEALSRGAKSAIINCENKNFLKAIKKNVNEICPDERIKISEEDGRFLRVPSFNQIDIIFCKINDERVSFTNDIIQHVRKNKGSLKEILFVLECCKNEIDLISDDFGAEDVRRYGSSFIKIWNI